MENSRDHIDDLIGKKLAGEASVDEIARVESWARESDDNRKYVEQFRLIYEQAAAIKSLGEYDTEAAWAKVSASLQKERTKTIRLQPDKKSRNLMWRVAASVLVVISVGIFTYRLLSPAVSPPVVVASTKTVVTDILPDGSKVVLNKKSTLAYSVGRDKQTHRIKLSGEAYFDVKHDETKSMIIEIDGVYVRDIGTSFNVKAYPDSSTIEVVVEEGEVMFYTEYDSGVSLRENGRGIYNKITRKFTIDQPEVNALAYKTRQFTFRDTVLGDVVDALNNVYDKKIFIGKNLRNCHLTVSFDNERQDVIVSIIAETLGLSITKTDDLITLVGPGCENE